VSPLEYELAVPQWCLIWNVSKILSHNENGLCFDHRSEKKVELLASHLQNLITNPALVRALGTAGLKVNQTHSNEKLATQFLNEFELMITK
jgi:hypothetical protein